MAVLVVFLVVFTFGTAFALANGGLDFGGHVSVDSRLSVVFDPDPYVVSSAVQSFMHHGMSHQQLFYHHLSPLDFTYSVAHVSGATAVQNITFRNQGYVVIRYVLRNTGTISADLISLGPARISMENNNLFPWEASLEHRIATVNYSDVWENIPANNILDLSNVTLERDAYLHIYVRVSYLLVDDAFGILQQMHDESPDRLLEYLESPWLFGGMTPNWSKTITYSVSTRH